MSLRIAIIGYGAVAEIHARQLAARPEIALASVFGPQLEKAAAFAAAHGIANPTADFSKAIALADAAIICSPSPLHFAQAAACLEAGVHALVELPPCETADEAARLDELARNHVAMCAHTSRFLSPYLQIKRLIETGALGAIQQVSYLRHIAPRQRGWTDDALLHHAAHPLDLLLDWFGELTPVGCVALPQSRAAQSVSLLAALTNGAPVSISVSYASRLPQARMLIVGERHTVETDGFSFLYSDDEQARFTCDAHSTYEQAIGEQDAAFVAACGNQLDGAGGVAWNETLKLMRLVNHFQSLAENTLNAKEQKS